MFELMSILGFTMCGCANKDIRNYCVERAENSRESFSDLKISRIIINACPAKHYLIVNQPEAEFR